MEIVIYLHAKTKFHTFCMKFYYFIQNSEHPPFHCCEWRCPKDFHMLAKVTILLCHQLPFHPHSAMGFFPSFFSFFLNFKYVAWKTLMNFSWKKKKKKKNYWVYMSKTHIYPRFFLFNEKKKILSTKQIIVPIQLQ